MGIRLSTLRQELDEKQARRAELTQQNAKLAEKVAQLEDELKEFISSLELRDTRIEELKAEKSVLQGDLDKIMGKLTRW